MKIVHQISASALAIAFATSAIPQKVNANPAALAVPAICAGTAGVGCVLVGVGIIGGTVAYYVWQREDGGSIKITPSGTTYQDNPSTPLQWVGSKHNLPESLQGKESDFRKRCQRDAAGRNWRVEKINNKLICFIDY